MTDVLTENLSLEPAQLYVGDITQMTQFYSGFVGLETLETSPTRVLLGGNRAGAIELLAKRKLAHARPGSAGLFHNAILFGSRGELSRAAGRILTEAPHYFSGTGDHLVSEAFYFNDPEGNGVELYYDRPSTDWKWVNGHVQMDTLYIDPIKYIYKNAGEQAGRDKKLGHVHLKVGDITEARKFYVGTLGFAITASVPGALFVSVAGYHHHIGLNTWMSAGAGKRDMTLGLSDVAITLQSASDISKLAVRLEEGNIPFAHNGDKLIVHDPWNNRLSFSVR